MKKRAKKNNTGVGIGIVGMGFMGLTHLAAAAQLRGGRVTALVTTDPRKARGDFSRVSGNFDSGADAVSLNGITVHPTLEDLLADETVDVVDICLPSYLHARAAIAALRAGKHVLVEKPVALSVRDASRMIETARKHGRLLMVAQVLKYFPEFAGLEKSIRSARHGDLLALHLRRIIAKPDWGDSWFADPKKSGGMTVDLHIHDTDLMVYLFGRPRAVTSHGLVRDRQIDALRTTYHYRGGQALLTSEAGWINSPSLPFEHGFDAYFERGTIHFNSTHTPQPTVFGQKSSHPLRLSAKDGFRSQLQDVVGGVRSGEVPARLSPENAALSLSVCLAEERSVRSKKTVEV